MRKSKRKLVMKKKTKVILSMFLVLLLVVGGFCFGGNKAINKLFSDKKTVSNPVHNNEDISLDGLKVSFLDGTGTGANPVDYGKLTSANFSTGNSITLKIENSYSANANIELGSIITDGLNAGYQGTTSFTLGSGGEQFVTINYEGLGTPTDGDVYYFKVPITYTLSSIYDGDSTTDLMTFTKTAVFAVNYIDKHSYDLIEVKNYKNGDGATDINFTMTPTFANTSDYFYAETSYDAGSCNRTDTNRPGKCSANYYTTLYYNVDNLSTFGNAHYSFDIVNLDTEDDERIITNGSISPSWNDSSLQVPSISTTLTSGIANSNGTGTFTVDGNLPNAVSKTLTIPVNLIANCIKNSYVGTCRYSSKTEGQLTFNITINAYDNNTYNGLRNLIVSQEQSGYNLLVLVKILLIIMTNYLLRKCYLLIQRKATHYLMMLIII